MSTSSLAVHKGTVIVLHSVHPIIVTNTMVGMSVNVVSTHLKVQSSRVCSAVALLLGLFGKSF